MERRTDLVAAHAAIVPRDLLVQERRNLYAVAAELAAPRWADLPAETLDCPVTRAAIGRVLAGTHDMSAADLVPLDALAGQDDDLTDGPHRVALASRAGARTELAEAVAIVAAHAAELDPQAGRPVVLTEADGREFERAAGIVAAGVALARAVDRELLDDLLPHVAVVAVLEEVSAGRLGSASAQEYPGLVLIPAPRTALEVAEALVHEGAHQKLFDLGITRDLLGNAARTAPPHRPSWAPRDWPLQQVFAAWHAYSCMARFWSTLPGPDRQAVSGASLLPFAAERAAELAEHLLVSGAYLGGDAHLLLAHLTGRRPVAAPAVAQAGSPGEVERWLAEGSLVHRRAAGGRSVAGRAGRPPEIFWVTAAESIPDMTRPG